MHISAILSLLLMASQAVDNSKLSARFTRCSLDIQRDLAKTVKSATNKTVYLYDSTSFFSDATNITVSGIRCLEKAGLLAVLSTAAQRTFPTSNTYIQYTTEPDAVQIGAYGVFLKN